MSEYGKIDSARLLSELLGHWGTLERQSERLDAVTAVELDAVLAKHAPVLREKIAPMLRLEYSEGWVSDAKEAGKQIQRELLRRLAQLSPSEERTEAEG